MLHIISSKCKKERIFIKNITEINIENKIVQYHKIKLITKKIQTRKNYKQRSSVNKKNIYI